VNIKRKNKDEENVLLGIRKEKYLVYPDVSGMVNWLNKDKYEEIDEEYPPSRSHLAIGI